MKKILFSLSLCFLLFISVNFIKIKADSIVLDSGENLIITDVKAQYLDKESKEFKQIPDGTGFFKEPVGGYITYIQDNISYDVVRVNRFLPSEINKPSENLLPSMYDNIYVYDGYWSYIEKDKPYIFGFSLSKNREYNFYNLGSFDELINTNSYINNTIGYFYLDVINGFNVFVYKFYNTYKVDEKYYIDSSSNYMIYFFENSLSLPNNLKYLEKSDYFNPSSISYYSSINGKWSEIKSIIDCEHEFYFDGCYISELEPYSNNFYITTYFNIFDNKINYNLLKLDFLSEIKFSYSYKYLGKLVEKTKILVPSDDFLNSNIGLGHLFIYEEFIDSESSDIDYFYVNNNYYRFKASIDQIPTFAKHKTLIVNVDHASFLYKGIIYNVSNPNQNFSPIFVNNKNKILNIIKTILFFIFLIFIFYLLFKFIKKIKMYKKNKK